VSTHKKHRLLAGSPTFFLVFGEMYIYEVIVIYIRSICFIDILTCKRFTIYIDHARTYS